MDCSACGAPNREGARFCASCGAPFALRCPGCGAPRTATARFCDACGRNLESATYVTPQVRPRTPPHLAEKILRTRSAVEGERKQVTVLFADVKGSMDLAETIDPEEWRSILDRFFEILLEGVHRFEGTINQFTGDGIMALFGAPIAHEDHAVRACFATLQLSEALGLLAREIRRERGFSFSVRMGLNSGEVVVGTIGDDLRMDYTAIGHTVGLAQRMESLAESGRIYLTEHTARLVDGFFELEDLGPFEIKGSSEPIRVYELRGPGRHRTRLDVSRARGFTRFVGRRAELAQLRDALDASAAGDGRVMTVVGPAGVGKSRLCHELVQEARARGVKVVEAHGVAHGRAMPFLPVLQLLRGYFGIDETDPPATARQKIAGGLLLLDERFRDALPLVFDFLGVPDPDLPYPQLDPEVRLGQLYTVVRDLIRARSERGPAVVWIEDLQWIDEGTEGFLAQLIEAVPGTRTLLLCNARPPYDAPWLDAPGVHRVPLQPLGPDAMGELLDALLGRDPSVGALARRIEGRTAGNPFFVEEVVRELVASGVLQGEKGAYVAAARVDDISIPASVQAVLAARVDRLPDRQKTVLQTAAVIGREVPEPVLRDVTGSDEEALAGIVEALVEDEFLYRRSLYPEAELGFTHPLTQEVAYRSQLAERRRVVHADVARAIESLYEDRLDELAGLVAHHWEHASERLLAARWSRRAAEWTGRRDVAAAVRHWARVEDHLRGAGPSEERDALLLAAHLGVIRLGAAVGIDHAEASRRFEEGRAIADRLGDIRSLARLHLVHARLRGFAGAIDEAGELSREAARLAEEVGLSGLRLASCVNLSGWAWQAGRLTESLRILDEALASPPSNIRVGAEHLGYSPYIWLVMHRGRILTWLGRWNEAAEALESGIALAREHDEPGVLCWAHQGRVDLAWLRGDARTAMAHARSAVEVAERIAILPQLWSSYLALGRAQVMEMSWVDARDSLEHALSIIRERHTGLHVEPVVLGTLALALAGNGEPERAEGFASDAVECARSRGLASAEVYAVWARAHVLRGVEASDVDTDLAHALAILGDAGSQAMEPALRVELAERARRSGDTAVWERELREAERLYRTMGAPWRADALVEALVAP